MLVNINKEVEKCEDCPYCEEGAVFTCGKVYDLHRREQEIEDVTTVAEFCPIKW